MELDRLLATWPVCFENTSVMRGAKIAVITAAYNAERFLDATIQSVAAQTYRNFEHVIVDDSSTDNTNPIASMYAREDSRFRVLRMPSNVGPGAARNRGVAETRAPFLAFIDSDDCWEPDFLRVMSDELSLQGPDCIGVFCHSQIVDVNGAPTGFTQEYASGPYDFFRFFRHIFPPGNGSTFLIHRRYFEKAGGFGNIRSFEDLDLCLRILRPPGHRYYMTVPRRLVRYRELPGSLSRNGAYIETGWRSRIERHVGVLPQCQRWVVYYNFARFYGPRAPDTHRFGTTLMRRALFSPKTPREFYHHLTEMLLPAIMGWKAYLASRRFVRNLLARYA